MQRKLFQLGTVGLVALTLIGAGLATAEDSKSEERNPVTKHRGGRILVTGHAGLPLSRVLHMARPGDTIRITGTITERVIITTDGITLDGQGVGILDGGGGGPAEFDGVVTIDGARNVTITGLTIQNGPGEGIIGQHAAVFTVRDTIVQDCAGTGLAVDGGSAADVTDCTLQRNLGGLDVFTNSTAILRGAVDVVENTGSGATVTGESIVELRGATAHFDRNGTVGLAATSSSQVAIFGFSVSQGSTLTADGNGTSGIFIADGQLSVFGASFFGSAANTISASNNGGDGIELPGNGALVAPHATANIVVKDNAGVGLNLGLGSMAAIIGGVLDVQGNATGLLADGAGASVLVAIPPGSLTIQDNTDVDVDLRFGSRMTIVGVDVGTMTCDGTVLTRGFPTCP